jgi:kynureninase
MKSLIITIVLLFQVTDFFSQQSVVAAGGDIVSPTGSISFSIGQIAYKTNGVSEIVSEGVQQPYEIYILTSIHHVSGIELNLNVFPNPTTEVLTLKIDQFILNGLNYQLFDAAGKLLEKKQITNELTTINTSSLVPAAYFLHVCDQEKQLKNFKIIKN